MRISSILRLLMWIMKWNEIKWMFELNWLLLSEKSHRSNKRSILIWVTWANERKCAFSRIEITALCVLTSFSFSFTLTLGPTLCYLFCCVASVAVVSLTKRCASIQPINASAVVSIVQLVSLIRSLRYCLLISVIPFDSVSPHSDYWYGI